MPKRDLYIVAIKWGYLSDGRQWVNKYLTEATRARQARRRVWRFWIQTLGKDKMADKEIIWAAKVSTFVKREVVMGIITDRQLEDGL